MSVVRTTGVVVTTAGAVQGVALPEAEVFRGVPYAAPPVGPLRFRAPRPAPVWTGVRRAERFGPVCPQRVEELDVAMGADDQPQDEAGCLTLTVWRPHPPVPHAGLPVMVWVHGGALVGGASSWPQYSGERFARDGVVFVGLNYRLHALGFLNLGTLFPGAGDDVLDVGLHDLVQGLQWVRENIRAFGGDPGRVTVLGESAGGGLVNALLVLPQARGLFRRAILQSGTAVIVQEPEVAEGIARNFLAAVGVNPGDRSALERVPVEDVLAVQDLDLTAGTGSVSGIPWLFLRHPGGLDLDGLEGVTRGRAAEIDLLLGWTVDEYRLAWLTQPPVETSAGVDRISGEELDVARRLYAPLLGGATAAEVDERIVNDQHFLAPAVAIAEARRARGGAARLYEFRWRSPVHGGRIGAAHALEIPFVFDQPVAPRFHGGDPLPPSLVDAMHGDWIRFAATGDPSAPGRPFPVLDPEAFTLMAYETHPRLVHEPLPEQRAFWRGVAPSAIGIA